MNSLYDKGCEGILDQSINLKGGQVSVALVRAGYSVDLVNHKFLSDLGGNIATTNGGGGQAKELLANPTVTGRVFSASDPAFTNPPPDTNQDIGFVVIFVDTGNAATSRLIAYFDTSASGTGLPINPSDGGEIDVSWDTSGIFSM